MTYVIGAIAFIFVLGLIVLIHEGGHFYFAKKAGILCHEFSIGMGPVLWQWKRGETVYSIRLIPIGGYVSMAGEEVESDLLKDVKKLRLELDERGYVKTLILNLDNERYQDLPLYHLVSYNIIGSKEALEDELYIRVRQVDAQTEREADELLDFTVCQNANINYYKKQAIQIAPYNRNFVHKTLWQRFRSVFAGPLMNFVLAIVIFFVIGCIQGYPNTGNTILDSLDEGVPAQVAGLQKGDKIISIGGQTLSKWDDISTVMAKYGKGESFHGKIQIVYQRNGEQKTVEAVPYVFIYSIEMAFKVDSNTPLSPIVGTYTSESVNQQTKSYKAGLRVGDVITKLTAENLEKVVTSRNDVLSFFNDSALAEGQKIKIEVTRNGEKIAPIEIEVYSKDMLASQKIEQTKVQLGISPEYKFDVVKLLYQPFVRTGDACLTIFRTLGLLFTDSSVNVDDLSGPIGIFTLLTSVAQQGIVSILSWTAILSVNVGLVNLLPLPALDGGRLAFLGYEAVTKKKPNPKVENIIHSIGFILLMLLFVFISFSDIMRCVGVK